MTRSPGRDAPELRESDHARFWSKVDKNGPVPAHRPDLGPCWLWTAGLTKRGKYGQFMVRGRVLKAHRLAFELLRGPVNELCVCHHCDNPPCCNPGHMFLGTHERNHNDMRAKKRHFVPDSPKGELHHSACLTVEQVKLIRSSPERGTDLAKKLGVTQSAVSRVRLGKVWKHVG